MDKNDKRCSICKYYRKGDSMDYRGYFDGYVCTNKDSDYYNEFVDYCWCCDRYRRKERNLKRGILKRLSKH